MTKTNISVLKHFSAQRASVFPVSACTFLFMCLAIQPAFSNESVPMIKNISSGETVFHDDFEAYDVPFSPRKIPLPDASKAIVGSWQAGMVFNPLGTLNVGVVNQSRSATTKVPSQQGEHFLMMYGRPGEPVGQSWQGNGLVANSGDGDAIEVTIAFYITKESNRGFVYLYGGPHQNQLLAAFSLNGINLHHKPNSVASHNGEGFEQTSLRFEPDTWNTLTVRHINGSEEYEVFINGGRSVKVDGYRSSENKNLNAVFFNQTTDSARGTEIYFDAAADYPASLKR
jgi:hypothetical protein